MNVKKQAMQDAIEYARAQMFFGEGAGTRRKLIENSVAWKIERVTGYHEAFNKALANQNLADHAEKAMKERKRLDRSKAVERNVRGMLNGNKRSLTTGVMVIGTVAYYAHETGADKAAWAYSKKQYKRAKHWAHAKRVGLHIPDSPKDL